MTQAAEISVGDRMYVVSLDNPFIGTVIALTDEPGKMIGIELDEPAGYHTCDGRGKNKYCIWVSPEQILTEVEFEDEKKAKEAAANITKYKEYKKITLKQ